MQKFEMPKLSVEEFEIVDVIMTISEEIEAPSCPDELPGTWD